MALKIHPIQLDIVWENAKENRNRLTHIIQQLPVTDMIILPEMFTTGFSMNVENLAETMQGDTVVWMQQQAQNTQAVIIGSIIIVENKQYYNRLLVVFPSGEIKYYNKRHLFSLANEQKHFTKGTERLVFDYKNFRICPLICYDLRFPVFSRNTDAIDLYIYIASWPQTRIIAWDILLKARAIENMSYVVGVNRIGTDSSATYVGHTQVLDALGDFVLTVQTEESFVQVILEPENVWQTRKKLNFLADADTFTIQ